MILKNISKDTIIAKEPRRARSLWSRTRGMIGRKFISFDALIFEHCNAIHTIFMSQKIDVLFLDGDNRVKKAVSALPPWVPFYGCKKAKTVIELPEGTVTESKTEPGDFLDLDVRQIEQVSNRSRKLIQEIAPEASVSLYGDPKQ